MYNTKARIAIVYDWIDKWGGVERVLLYLHRIFPTAHFFTSAVDYKNAQWAQHLSITSSFIQSFPSILRLSRPIMTPLYPLAFESFTFDEYDLVISVTSAFAKGIITKPDTTHICYLLTPPRYLWSHKKDYITGIKSIISSPLLNHLQQWDVSASKRPDAYISISRTTSDRAKKYYDINSPVVYPPFDTFYWDRTMKEMVKSVNTPISKPFYLWVGRMESYKKVHLIIEAAKHFKNRNFIFVGTGSLELTLKKGAPQNCHFTGIISDNELSYLYSQAKALIMPQREDFGYVALEAQYHGCPVIAYRGGGACETVQEGRFGYFFNDQTVPSLISQLERYEQISYNLVHSRQQIQKSIIDMFGVQRFEDQFVYQLNQHIAL